MLLLLSKHASSKPPREYATLRWLMSAAAPLLEEVIAKTRTMFGREVLRNGFGMSELVATAIATLPGGWFHHIRCFTAPLTLRFAQQNHLQKA